MMDTHRRSHDTSADKRWTAHIVYTYTPPTQGTTHKTQHKSDSKSSYAYVRSKQNVRDKVGPLENNVVNKITQGYLMAEELNMHFSSVFTRDDTSSLPVPETKFKGSERKGWGS